MSSARQNRRPIAARSRNPEPLPRAHEELTASAHPEKGTVTPPPPCAVLDGAPAARTKSHPFESCSNSMTSAPRQKRRPEPKLAPDLITRAELARRKGVARSTAQRACNTFLAAAMVGDRVDATHPSVVAWLGATADAEGDIVDLTKADFARLTFRKRKAEAEKLELANAVRKGELVSREQVTTHVFGPLEELSQRLLRDHPKNTAHQAFELFHAGAPVEAIEKLIREDVSMHLSTTRDKVTRALRAMASRTTPKSTSSAAPKAKSLRAAAARRRPAKS